MALDSHAAPFCAQRCGRNAPIASSGDAMTAHLYVSRCTCPMNHAATAAVTDPTTAIPTIMRVTATNRPSVVTGYRSPYPTVITVVAAHHRASPNVVMFASASVPLSVEDREGTESDGGDCRSEDVERYPSGEVPGRGSSEDAGEREQSEEAERSKHRDDDQHDVIPVPGGVLEALVRQR